MEPRRVGDLVTRWDIESSPPDMLTEAKLTPTRGDMTEWLSRIRETNSGGAFAFVFGKQATGLLSNVEMLMRLAAEAHGDIEAFSRLVQAQEIPNSSHIVMHSAHPSALGWPLRWAPKTRIFPPM
jgi:hypothetical protein